MVLDCNNGTICVGDFLIKPYMGFSEFKKLISIEQMLSYESVNGINVLITPQKCEDVFLLIRLFFDRNDEKLKSCQVAILDNDEIPSWEKWSYENERLRKVKNENWLLKETQRINYIYKWGEVKSVYNELECSSYIVFKYT